MDPSPSSRLPADVWARVFAAMPTPDFGPVVPKAFRKQARIKRMALVCRAFNKIVSDAQFTSALVLCDHGSQRLPSLLSWLQKHSSSVRSLITTGNDPCLEATLNRLLVSTGSLSTVQVRGCIPSTIMMLAKFTSLRSCELHSWERTLLDLTPLQGLISMTSLTLISTSTSTSHGQSHFAASQLPVCLASLVLDHVALIVAEPCCCVSSLQELSLDASTLFGLHPAGLSACGALTKLHCNSGHITASNRDQRLALDSGKEFWLPLGLSSLTSLTSIDLTIESQQEEEIGLSGLHSVVSLVTLSVCSSHVSVSITSGFSALTNLQHLDVNVEGQDLNGQSLQLIANVDWEGMQCLQHLSLHSECFVCGPNLVTLLKVLSLNSIDVSLATSSDDDVRCRFYGMFIYGLGKCRPDITLSICGESVSRTAMSGPQPLGSFWAPRFLV